MPATARIAAECGIAEGTLFRVFATKDDLVDAVQSAVGCPAAFRRGIDALPLEETPTVAGLHRLLLALARLLRDRFAEFVEVLGPLGWVGPPPHHDHPGCPYAGGEVPGYERFRESMTTILAPYEPMLRTEPMALVESIRFLAFAATHPGLNEGRPQTPEAIVDLLLDGALASDARGWRSRATASSDRSSPLAEPVTAGARRTPDQPHRPERPAAC